MLFQKNACVDTEVMIDLGKAFVEHVKEKHNGLWVLLFCSNSSSNDSKSVQGIFGVVGVFLCSFPSSKIESLQPIDAGYDRSSR